MIFPRRFAAVLLCVCFAWSVLSAQIGKDFSELDFKGPVKQIISTSSYSLLDEDGKEQQGAKTTVLLTYANGHPVKIEYESNMGASTHWSTDELEWEGEQLQLVRRYDQYSIDGKKRLDRRYLPIYGNDDQILVENIIDNKDKLMASLRYKYSRSQKGNKVIEMTMYKPSSTEPQGYYYIESDDLGEVLHIEAVGRDTGLYSFRTEQLGDSVLVNRRIISSRRNRGEKDTIDMRQEIKRDSYGNPTEIRTIVKQLNDSAFTIQNMITRHEYLYEGEEGTIVSLADRLPVFKGKWTSIGYNMELTLGISNEPTNGIYSVQKLREKDPEIVEEGSDWVFELRESMIGEWYYDEGTKTITFMQNQHEVVKVRATVDNYRMSLEPEEEYSASLSLKKN